MDLNLNDILREKCRPTGATKYCQGQLFLGNQRIMEANNNDAPHIKAITVWLIARITMAINEELSTEGVAYRYIYTHNMIYFIFYVWINAIIYVWIGIYVT